MNKCIVCNKLTTITCKCEKNVCIKHRYVDMHNCTFNYRYYYKQKLENQLVRIKPVKIDKI